MKSMDEKSIDVVVTSPPYNLDIAYNSYEDNLPYLQYLEWTSKWASEVKRVLKPEGSFFLNVSGSCVDPWISFDVAQVVRKCFVLQNRIVWAKSISIDDKSFGHFKPINSARFLNHLHEDIYHFTIAGKTKLDKLAIGVPYEHKSNLTRWKGSDGNDLRCRGNIWFIPYETIQNKLDKGEHPAIFPVKLAENCIRLHGVDKCNIVLDPFGGTGSTTVACNNLGLSSICIDIDQKYLDYAKTRV